jgi:hypothetical protein
VNKGELVMADFLLYAGAHPWQGDGWQIAFDFSGIQVSIAYTSKTQGVELMAWGLFMRPLVNVTPAQALNVLSRLMARTNKTEVLHV